MSIIELEGSQDSKQGIQSISLDNLLVFEDNPRNIEAVNQRDEIHKMIEDSNPDANYKQLSNLAESMILYGQSPFDNIGVIYSENYNKYITVEGNRRVTALKLFINPSLAEEFPKVKRVFSDLKQKYGVEKIPQSLRCVIFPSFDNAKYWINLKHTGLNEGAGVRDWNRTQKQRFGINSLGEPPSSAFALFEYIRKNPFVNILHIKQLDDITNTTTLERIIDDPESRKSLYLEKQGNTFTSSDDETTAKLLSIIVDDLVQGALPVSRVYDKRKRAEYIRMLYQKVGIHAEERKDNDQPTGTENSGTGHENGGEEPRNVPADDQEQHDARNKEDASSGEEGKDETDERCYGYDVSKRKKLKTGGYKVPPITHPKSAQLHDDMVKLDCRKVPIIVGICLRSYIEYTCRIYLNTFANNIPSKNEKISVMLKKCSDSLLSRSDERIKHNLLAVTFDEKGENPDVALLNGFVHHDGLIPHPEQLFKIWDNLSPFLTDLWNAIAQEEKKSKKKR